MILGVREENSQRDQLCGIQRKLLYSRGCKSDTFVFENVIKYMYHDNVRTDSIGISSSIVQGSARTRCLDFSKSEEV